MIPSINNIKLLKIIKPTWYYYFQFKNNSKYWVDYRDLSFEKKKHIDFCNVYEDEKISLLDAMYQAWHKGLITQNSKIKLDEEYDLSFFDQYVFIRRMSKPKWVFYIILVRMFTFKMSLSEWIAILRTMSVKRIQLNQPSFKYDINSSSDYKNFNKNQLISIIIPTLNRYPQLDRVLINLEIQEYKNFEVIIIDQSDNFDKIFYEKYNLNIKVLYQKEKAVWRARNKGVLKSKSNYLLFLDDDSIINPNWILEHLKYLHFFNADISAGVSLSLVGSPVPKHYSHIRWGDQLDTGNVLIKKKVFEKVGLFDLQFEGMRMGDHEFGARSHQNGFTIINNHRASREHLKTSMGGFRERIGWDAFRPKSLFSPRPLPSVLYLFRKYWGNNAAIYSLVLNVPISLMPYKYKGKKIGYLISALIFISCFPFILFQVSKSWVQSSSMLKSGPKIEFIK